jgi:hypothetical protein
LLYFHDAITVRDELDVIYYGKTMASMSLDGRTETRQECDHPSDCNYGQFSAQSVGDEHLLTDTFSQAKLR